MHKKKNTHRGGKTRFNHTVIVIREAMSVFSCREPAAHVTLSCCCAAVYHNTNTQPLFAINRCGTDLVQKRKLLTQARRQLM
jgi:hypothetical protein